jgi:hypothetical protein
VVVVEEVVEDDVVVDGSLVVDASVVVDDDVVVVVSGSVDVVGSLVDVEVDELDVVEVELVVGVPTGWQEHGPSRSSPVHSSSGGQLPPQSGKIPPQVSGNVVLVVLLLVVVVVESVDVEVLGSSVVEVDDVAGASVVELLDVVEEVVGTSVVELVVDVEELVGTAVVELLDDDDVDEVVGAAVEVVVLVDVDELELLDVVVPPNVAAKPAISRIEFPAPSLQVETNSESGWIGSKTRPKGGAVKPSAKRASVGVIAPPSGRPVAGSMTTRHSSPSVKLA